MGNFFTKADSGLTTPRAPLRVIQQANPPASDAITESTYKWFPIHVASTQNLDIANSSTWTGGALQWRLWQNRWNNGHNKRPNRTNPVVTMTGGTEVWLEYTSIAKANAATLARCSCAAGYSSADSGNGYGDICTAAGLTMMTWSAFNAAALAGTLTTHNVTISGTTYAVVTDICVLPKLRLVDSIITQREVLIDYERQDLDGSAGQADTLAQILAVAALCHAKGLKLTLYTNALDGGQVGYNGYGSNIDTILAAVDYWQLFIFASTDSGAVESSFYAQIGAFGGPDMQKFQIMFFMDDSTQADADTMRYLMEKYRVGGLELFGANFGGDCTSNPDYVGKIAVLTGLAPCP